ncbi:hypothetical protein [Campylobacter pinnipediorum]|nr:hypothetical protein [Campylobacter pinnipediorum]
MKNFLDIFMVICLVGFLFFMIRGVILQTAKKDELRKKIKQEEKKKNE